MRVFYGIESTSIDVTDIVYSKMHRQHIAYIPKGDVNRAVYFSDPVVGIVKSIFIIDSNHNDNTSTNIRYDDTKDIYINTITNEVFCDNVPEYVFDMYPEHNNVPERKLSQIHNKVQIKYGSFSEEYPEQLMACKYLTGNESVLEIGGNIGRNSIIVSYILAQKNNYNMVVLESDSNTAKQLEENRDLNGLQFHIENAALSKRKLIQRRWDTMVSDEVLPGYFSVNTITYDELMAKYGISFDTLVLDCEGAFYYILMDMPEILNGVNLIIMENDYAIWEHKQYVDDILIAQGFKTDYREYGGWGPCYGCFFEVWKK